jgi:membrane fusion protein, multidrug efflux system
MRKVLRYLVVVGGLLALVVALAAVKFLQISSLMAMGEDMAAAGPPPEAVGSAVAEKGTWETTVSAVGSVAGVKSVAISNDAPGRVVRIHFESGDVVKEGRVLVELDSSVERAQLASAGSRRSLALTNARRMRALVDKGVVSRADLDAQEAELQMASADQAALSAIIDRKVVRAPFDGKVGIRDVNVGQYLNPGTPLTTLEAVGAVYVDFSLPQRELGRVAVDMQVRLTLPGAPPLEGVISAVAPTVDGSTRSLQLRASVANPDGKLRPGMFAHVTVVMPVKSDVVAVPVTAIVHASYGDSVFVLEDKAAGTPGASQTPDGKTVMTARQQFVRLGEARGDFVAIAEGIEAGQVVVSAGAFKLRNGAPVVVDNTVQTKPELDPRPENH